VFRGYLFSRIGVDETFLQEFNFAKSNKVIIIN